MNISANSFTDCQNTDSVYPSSTKQERKYHRIAEVRREQGVSLRSAARQLKMDMATVRYQENATTNLSISELNRWQKVLDVPLSDLLVEPTSSLSTPIMERARMVRIMKTAAALNEQSKTDAQKRLAKMLVEQLTDIMPELENISAWHSVGQRRSLDEYGRVMERRLRDDFFTSAREE